NIDIVHPAVDAIADRDVDEPILPRHRHSRLTPRFGKRKQPRAAPAAEDHAQYRRGGHGRVSRIAYGVVFAGCEYSTSPPNGLQANRGPAASRLVCSGVTSGIRL